MLPQAFLFVEGFVYHVLYRRVEGFFLIIIALNDIISPLWIN